MSEKKNTNIKRIPIPRRRGRFSIVSILLIGLLLFTLVSTFFTGTSGEEVGLNQIISEIKEEQVKEIRIRDDRLEVLNTYDEEKYALISPGMDIVKVLQDEEGVDLANPNVKLEYSSTFSVGFSDILNLLLLVGTVVLIFIFLRNMQNAGGRIFEFGKSKAKMIFGRKPQVTFKDVAGIDEAKEELAEVVDFLKDPKKYMRMGAKIPKGIMLFGPPGTGKTLMARAIAGEAGVPFFHTSGAEFEEMLVGAGASRVRDLFDKAKKAAPCIIFMDEIDAVARKRGTNVTSGATEQTLNQILTEMDGFEKTDNVIVLAATNRPDVLDPALLRPGRFDRHVYVELPDAKGREEIIKIHAKNKKLEEGIDFERIARRTVGFSGADIENMLNESAILAVKREKKKIGFEEVEEASVRVQMGREKKSRKKGERDLKITAYHEAGHAVVSAFTPESDPVHKISIVSRGRSAGVTMMLPQKDEMFATKTKLISKIAVNMAGNAAEEMVFHDVTTGASSDIEQSTQLAKNMVKKYGMSKKMGMVKYGQDDERSDLGYHYGGRDYSEETAREIDDEVRELMQEGYKEASKLLGDHRELLDELAEKLLEVEVVDMLEFEEMVKKYKKLKAKK